MAIVIERSRRLVDEEGETIKYVWELVEEVDLNKEEAVDYTIRQYNADCVATGAEALWDPEVVLRNFRVNGLVRKVYRVR